MKLAQLQRPGGPIEEVIALGHKMAMSPRAGTKGTFSGFKIARPIRKKRR